MQRVTIPHTWRGAMDDLRYPFKSKPPNRDFRNTLVALAGLATWSGSNDLPVVCGPAKFTRKTSLPKPSKAPCSISRICCGAFRSLNFGSGLSRAYPSKTAKSSSSFRATQCRVHGMQSPARWWVTDGSSAVALVLFPSNVTHEKESAGGEGRAVLILR